MKNEVDLLIVSPGNNRVIYQELSREYAAIETPIWASLLGQYARTQGYGVAIADQEAEGLSLEQIAQRARDLKPRLVAIVVYGQQPSASTQNMTMAGNIAQTLKDAGGDFKTIMIGGHVSALPERSLNETVVDYVCQGEGPQTLSALLELSRHEPDQLKNVPGLWFRDGGKPTFARAATLTPQKELAQTLPGQAWDLLPMKNYRAHNWHCFGHVNDRQPYASIYTSLGCPFKCSFCCINAPFERHMLRCWDPEHVIKELDTLATQYGVKNIKIADEMFVLNDRHVLGLCDLIIERGYDFNFWAYARVDTVKDKFLEKLKKAGVNWLALGIESGSKHVRDGVEKGRFGSEDIYKVVKKIQEHDINVLGNYIFGMPDDSYTSMQETLDLAVDLNCEWANFYCAMAYPGSQLYNMAVDKGWQLPKEWHDYSQHSINMRPLPSEHVSAGEMISFRDKAWDLYFTNPKYLGLVEQRFGTQTADHVRKLAEVKLKRNFSEPLKTEPTLHA